MVNRFRWVFFCQYLVDHSWHASYQCCGKVLSTWFKVFLWKKVDLLYINYCTNYIVAIRNPERHVRKASHCGSKQQWWSCAAITLTIACSCYIYNGVVLHAHAVRGESHNQRNVTGEVATIYIAYSNTYIHKFTLNMYKWNKHLSS